MDEIPLRTILIESLDENSQNFSEYQIYLQEKVENDYETFIQQLLDEIQDSEAPYNVIFLLIVLINHCVQSSLIPIDVDNKELQTKLPLDLILQLFDITFIYLLHPEEPVRNASICLFSSLATTQINQLSEIGIDNRIIEMLDNAENYEALWSATQCIWSLMLYYKFNDEQQEIIIQNLFRILSIQDENITLLQSTIRMLGNFSYLINRLFNDDSKYLDFVTQILEFSENPELSEVVYNFMDDTIGQFPDILPAVIDRLLSNSLIDLESPAPRDVLIALIVMWGSIFSLDPSINSENLQPLVEPLVMIMQTVSVSEVLDYTEWEPYTAAFNCLQCFCAHFPDVVIPTLLDYITKASDSENPFDREGALKCLHIIFRISPTEKLPADVIPSALELLNDLLNDDAPRVRYESVCTLTSLIKRSNSCQSFEPFFQLLFKLTTDVEPTAKAAFKAIKLISRLEDFKDFAELYESLTDIVSSLPLSLIQNGIECFTLTHDSNITYEDAFSSFQFLFGLINQIISDISESQTKLSDAPILYTIDNICISLSSVIVHCDDSISPFVQELSDMIYDLFSDLHIPNSLLVVASISTPLPDFVQDQLPVFMPLIFNALQMFKSPSILIPTVRFIPLLINNLDLDSFFDELIEAMFDSLQEGESASTKVEVLESFYNILCTHSLLLAPFVKRLQLSIIYIIANLEIAYQSYLKATQCVVNVICKIQLKLLKILSQQDTKYIINSCIMLIVAVSKIPPLINLNSADLRDMIYFMLTILDEESKIKMLKVPAVSRILRILLKQVEKSDTEVDECISILTNQNDE